MGDSLREQLLKAGLVNEQQAKRAEQQLQRAQHARPQVPKPQRAALSKQELAAQQAQAAKAARDLELNRRQQEKADKRARHAQIKQLVEEHRLAKPETEESFNFVDGSKIRKIRADAVLRERVKVGELAIVRCEGRYELVPSAIAERIRERDARAVIAFNVTQQAETLEDDYREFAVPDDLMW